MDHGVKFEDTFFDSYRAAVEAALKARKDSENLVVQVLRSAYGGYRVRQFPADLYADLLADGLLPKRLLPIPVDLEREAI